MNYIIVTRCDAVHHSPSVSPTSSYEEPPRCDSACRIRVSIGVQPVGGRDVGERRRQQQEQGLVAVVRSDNTCGAPFPAKHGVGLVRVNELPSFPPRRVGSSTCWSHLSIFFEEGCPACMICELNVERKHFPRPCSDVSALTLTPSFFPVQLSIPYGGLRLQLHSCWLPAGHCVWPANRQRQTAQ